MFTITNLFDLRHTLAASYLSGFDYPWQALAGIADCIKALKPTLKPLGYVEVSAGVWVHQSAKVAPSAFLGAPCIIGPKTEIRHCAFVREAALVGADCIVGNSVELKNTILFDMVQVPHFNYVGDSILGYKSHLGAGAVTSNVKSDMSLISIKMAAADGRLERIQTGLQKCGAMLGDYVEVGCNTVLNPGTVIGRNSTIYPLMSVRGTVPANSIYKTGNIIIEKDLNRNPLGGENE